MKILHLIAWVFLFLALGSCSHDTNEFSSEDKAIVSFLEEVGYNESEVQLYDDAVHFADIRMSKKGMDDWMTAPKDEIGYTDNGQVEETAQVRQTGPYWWLRYHSVNWYYADDITVHFRPSLQQLNPDYRWVNAFITAINRWNGVSNCRVKFRIVPNTNADIIVAADTDPILPHDLQNLVGSTAKADFAEFNAAGKYISVNDSAANRSHADCRHIAIHELGHTLGLRHTDVCRECSRIYTTANWTDDASVMSQWGDDAERLSDDDKTAIRTMYPDAMPTPTIVSHDSWRSSGKSHFSLQLKNANFKEEPYYFIRLERYKTSGAYAGFKDFIYIPTDSNGTAYVRWTNMENHGNYKFSIKGMNFRRDKYSPKSQRVRMDFD